MSATGSASAGFRRISHDGQHWQSQWHPKNGFQYDPTIKNHYTSIVVLAIIRVSTPPDNMDLSPSFPTGTAALTAATAVSTWASYDLPLQDRPNPAAVEAPALTEADQQLLLQNSAWFCSLRWLVIAALLGIAILAWAASHSLLTHGIRLNPDWLAAVAGILVFLNLTYLAAVRETSRTMQPAVWAMRILWLQILLDLAVLTVVVHYVGSLETYAPFMYLFHIVLACIFLPYAQSLLVTLSAMGMYLACLVLESTGVVAAASVLAGSLMPDRSSMPLAVLAWHFGSVAFISGTVWYLASRLASALRQRDEELAAINRRLVAATRRARPAHAPHDPPIEGALRGHSCQHPASAWADIAGRCPTAAVAVIEQIAARCEMLSRGIKSMLQLANLRSHAQNPPPPVAVDLSALIAVCMAGLKPQAAKRGIDRRGGLLRASRCRSFPTMPSMIIDNILSNAINYSRDGQRVAVSSRAKPDGGGAVSSSATAASASRADKLPRIFDDYFRTTEAVKHNHASTGLGLAIVRQTALAGKIGVHVESAPRRARSFPSISPRPQRTSEKPN